jgi:hypothetical protein
LKRATVHSESERKEGVRFFFFEADKKGMALLMFSLF